MTSEKKTVRIEQVKAARALLGWTQRDLATAAEVGLSTIADYERGTRQPTKQNHRAICEALERAGIAFLDTGDSSGKGGYGVRLGK